MSKKGRKQKYTTEELETELPRLILRRDQLKLKRQLEHVERQLNGEESELDLPNKEEVEINEKISRFRSLINVRKH